MRSTLLILFFLFCLTGMYAQQKDMQVQDGFFSGDTIKVKKREGKYYNPKTAAKRSAIIPGWGQIYNDSWWKVPLLYGGFGLAIHYVYFNDEGYHTFRGLLNEERAKDNPNQNLIRIYSRNADTWRKNRDLVVLTMVGIYGLQIIDATVDAHLKGFNVDENLSLNLKPKLGVISDGTPFVGMKLTLPIGR